MDNASRAVLLLAGRMGPPDDGGPFGDLLERLDREGIAGQVLCYCRGESTGAGGATMGGPGCNLIERPDLGSRWQRYFAARRVRFDDGLRYPELLHVLQPSLAPLGLSIAERWAIPYVQTQNEFLPLGGKLRLSRRYCRAIIADSNELAGELIRDLAIPRDLVTVIPPGVAIPRECWRTTRRGVVPVIGTAGPLVASAGTFTFLNAARRVQDAGLDVEFVIAGQGEAEPELRRRAARLRISDRITFASRSVIGPRFWRVLDLFCQTSLVPTTGRTLAQAMAFGVPSIASDLPGLRSLIVPGETGLTVPWGDAAALARTLIDLLANPERAAEFGQAGRDRVAHEHDPNTEAQRLAALYRRVLDVRPVSHRQPALA